MIRPAPVACLSPVSSLACVAVLAVMAGVRIQAAEKPRPLTDKERQECAAGLGLPGVTAESLAKVSVCRDLEYARYGEKALLLDLYLPAGQQGPRPCVLVIAGGGFKAQDKSKFSPSAAHLAANGYAAACISYRGTPNDTYLKTIADTKAAVRWVRANAAKYGIDQDKIAAMGQSAGGHLAVMLATSGEGDLEGNAGNAGVSSRIQAAVSFSGVYNFISRLKDGGQQPEGKLLDTKRKTNGDWVGEPFSETGEAWLKASPITYVTADDPPVLLLHCRGDQTVPHAQGEEMYAAVHPLNERSRLVIYDGGSHGMLRAQGINEQAWGEMLRFLGEVLE